MKLELHDYLQLALTIQLGILQQTTLQQHERAASEIRKHNHHRQLKESKKK
jgi:hypothetical protein